jgi:hypothetical protein
LVTPLAMSCSDSLTLSLRSLPRYTRRCRRGCRHPNRQASESATAAEDVANIEKIRPCPYGTAAEPALRTAEAKLVVLLPLLRVGSTS